MENILLISPPVEEPDISRYLNSNVYMENFPRALPFFHSSSSQPVGLLKIATYLRKRGFNVRMIDCKADIIENRPNSIFRRTFAGYRKCGNFENEEIKLGIDLCGLPYDEFRERLKKEPKPSEIYVTSGLTYHNVPVHRIIEICKEVFPNVPVNLGGIYATLCYNDAKKSMADNVHRGPIEEAMHEDAALDLLDYNPGYAVVKTTYGCPNKCTYCSVHHLEGHRMNFKEPKKVVEEIKDKIKRHGIRIFTFWESNILVNYENHLKKILDGIINSNLKIMIKFPEGIQPNLMTTEIAKKMRKAGLDHISIPLETSNPELTKKLRRPSKLDDFENAVKCFRDAGFTGQDLNCFILSGMPGQKTEDIIESMRYVWKIGCKVKIMPFTPVPMSEDFDKNLGGKKFKYEDLHPFLMPFANSDMKVADLMCILSAIDIPPLLYTFVLKNRTDFLERVFTKNELDYLLKKSKEKAGYFTKFLLHVSRNEIHRKF